MSLPSTLSDISVLKLKVDKCSRQDTVFMKKVSPCDLSPSKPEVGQALWAPASQPPRQH